MSNQDEHTYTLESGEVVTVHTSVLKPTTDNSQELLAGVGPSAKSQTDQENQDTVLKEHGARCACVRSRTISGTSESSEDGVSEVGHPEGNLNMDMKRLSAHMMAALTLEETRLGSTLAANFVPEETKRKLEF